MHFALPASAIRERLMQNSGNRLPPRGRQPCQPKTPGTVEGDSTIPAHTRCIGQEGGRERERKEGKEERERKKDESPDIDWLQVIVR